MFRTVLIANRGEIALRIARTCRELGIRTVVVYSTADRDSAAVRFADVAVHIGPAPARLSYLDAAPIVEVALQTGAEAIHPGYGFLSEDPYFPEICEKHGIRFVGPPAAVVARLSDKAQAREVFAAAGLPVLPGSTGVVDSTSEAKELASDLGYPIMIKAAAGGGGRGITVVREAKELSQAFTDTRAYANAMFGDSRVYLEKYVESARHIEIQILADGHGQVVHLGARDCSVQRRWQKLIEETPPPDLRPSLVEEIADAAVEAASYLGYEGAGTFEFVVDEHDQYHFMELNCRLQVEHPVTEMVTGIDLVREQLRIAAGGRLELSQSDVRPSGVALECRVTAEDPERNFSPTPGTVDFFVPPAGPFTRVDTHLFPGVTVASDYDPLLAKVIVWAPDRDQALARMSRALRELQAHGPRLSTSKDFLRELIGHPCFRRAEHTTTIVDEVLQGRPRSTIRNAAL